MLLLIIVRPVLLVLSFVFGMQANPRSASKGALPGAAETETMLPRSPTECTASPLAASYRILVPLYNIM